MIPRTWLEILFAVNRSESLWEMPSREERQQPVDYVVGQLGAHAAAPWPHVRARRHGHSRPAPCPAR